MRWTCSLALVLFAAVAACDKKSEPPAPTCAQVTDHMLEVTKQMIAGHGEMGGGGQREAMIRQCEQRELSPETRRCLVAAKTLDAIAACRAGSSGGASPRPGTVPAPAPAK